MDMYDRIDEIDRKILAILSKDGRTPAAKIAEQIDLSRPAVADRLQRLERDGVLVGIAAVVDPSALGYYVTAFINAKKPAHLDARSRKTFDDLVARDEVLEVHSVAGEDCYLMKVRTDSIASLNTLVSSLTAPPLSFSTRTTIVMETHFEKVGSVVRGRKRS